MPTWRHRHFFGVLLILLSSVITGPSFMSILSMVLELWQFSFTRNWPETQKIPPVWVLLNIWVDLGIPTLAQMSLIKCQCLLQIDRVTTLTISELIRVTQHRTIGGGINYQPHTILLNPYFVFYCDYWDIKLGTLYLRCCSSCWRWLG